MSDNEPKTNADPTTPPASAATKRAKGNGRAPAAPPPPPHPRTGLLAGGLALIFGIIALVASAYLWYLLHYEHGELLATDLVGTIKSLEQEQRALKEELDAIAPQLQTLKETQETLRAALERLTSDLARRRADWSLAEAEQLMVIANNRLELARDLRSALAALRAADALLQQLADPKLLPVRRTLAREIAALEAMDKVDIPGISLRLVTLAERVDRLPLAPEIRLRETAAGTAGTSAAAAPAAAAAPSGESSWQETARRLWDDLRSLVRIRTDVEVQRPLLPPEQQYFARENLRLMLFGAQLALLQGNTALYRQNLEAAERLVRGFFDLDTQAVAAVLSELERLRAERLVVATPDLSASLEALRRVLAARQGAS